MSAGSAGSAGSAAAAADSDRERPEPIGLDWTVAQVLDRYPILLETLAGLYPGFARLRNPILRRLRAPRVRVVQAARIAGLAPEVLLRTLNTAAGVPDDTPAASGPVDGSPRAPNLVPGPVPGARPGTLSTEVEIDVSALEPPEPMVRILETLAELPPGATLRVHHARRPIYLYPRLDEMGCRHETVELPGGRIVILITTPAEAAQ